ncbi:MAG: hypothetical protein C4575_00555 [Desulforudis sp.]|nr:MAG: hypothetical protein C4575_00555 [Desulforudis sp.]
MKTCPRCGERKLDPEKVRNALSRRDNETYVCNDCGTDEAMYDLVLAGLCGRRDPFLLGAVRDQERRWPTEGRPLSEILGSPYVPLMARK